MRAWEYIAGQYGNRGRWEDFADTGACAGITCEECPFNILCKFMFIDEIKNILNREIYPNLKEEEE